MQSHNTTVTPLRQAVENLKDIEASLRDCFGFGPTVGVHVERMARILATALDDLDGRLANLEMTEANRTYAARLEAEMREASIMRLSDYAKPTTGAEDYEPDPCDTCQYAGTKCCEDAEGVRGCAWYQKQEASNG